MSPRMSDQRHDARQLLCELTELRQNLTDAAPDVLTEIGATGTDDPALLNLAHYLALRHIDLRPLQRRLMALGLSSLGRLEGRVLETLDAVIAALTALAGPGFKGPARSGEPAAQRDFFAGEERLRVATDHLFGPPPDHRHGRIMVTLPGEMADDASLMGDLVGRGMNVARINCAHDDAAVWTALAQTVRAAAAQHHREVRILMDIAGPKIRTEAVVSPKGERLAVGSRLRLVAEGVPRTDAHIGFAATASLPEIVNRLRPGDRVRYDDGKIEARVEALAPGEAILTVVHAKSGGVKLKPEKGLNLPDTALGLSPLTAKDEADLATVVKTADMIGYSFVSRAEDIDLLDAAVARFGRTDRPLGLIAKIELPDAVLNLPELIARARPSRPFGVMIARGDLAAELGFERMAEIQEEILWICEAASVPTVWATQVLEGLVKDGIPTRGEMTDAAMASRAECVMLNKGPEVGQAIELIDRLFQRMDAHFAKKTSVMRALKSW